MFEVSYEVQCGPEVYSPQTDETFCDTRTITRELDVSECCEAIAHYLTDSRIRDIASNKVFKKEFIDEAKQSRKARVDQCYYTLMEMTECVDADELFECYSDVIHDYWYDDTIENYY